MNLEQALYTRRATREFTGEAVDRSMLLRLIDAAIQAPSAVNEQPWSFTVVRDKRVLAGISAASKAHILRNPPREIASHHLEGHLRDPGFDIFYAAPALIVISSVVDNQWAIENCALAAGNLMLVACAEGLGTCWIGFAQMWLVTPEGKAILGAPAGHVPVAPITVGHPKSAPPPVPRKPPEVRWIGA
jgi:nitroreductase